jgi:ATP-dependent helicase/DNAse subunit B
VEYLDKNETRSLEVLSATNLWDRDLFEILMTKFDLGLQVCTFSDLIKYSFIKEDTNGKYSIHQLTRKSLREYQDPVNRKNVYKFMFEHYKNKLEKMDTKSITPEHEKALNEAFYHAKKILETKNLLNWVIAASGTFKSAALWQLITPIYEETLQILEVKLGTEHQDVGTALNNLAELYCLMGD